MMILILIWNHSKNDYTQHCLMLDVKKISSSLKIYLKYKINKHTESLPKVDKSITFHYTVYSNL